MILTRLYQAHFISLSCTASATLLQSIAVGGRGTIKTVAAKAVKVERSDRGAAGILGWTE
jgi:hypothetical protein